MFVNKLIEENYNLVKAAFELKSGGLLPDTYILDLDQIKQNAKAMIDKANSLNVKLYFMLKQIGRNPLVAKELMKLGFAGAVCVDFKDAEIMKANNIKIAHMGHLVQTPKSVLAEYLSYGVSFMTVYTYEKLVEIDSVCESLGIVQKIMLRCFDDSDVIYNGQECGLNNAEIFDIFEKAKALKNVNICGLTTFPCFLFDESKKDILPTNNLKNMLSLKSALLAKGFNVDVINAPSATCCRTLEYFGEYSLSVGEPGHSLTGTTPLHQTKSCEEKVAYCYVTEVSHNFQGNSYAYGGGYYRRSHTQFAIVGTSENPRIVGVVPIQNDSIDYHYKLLSLENVSDTVIMAMRTQIFVTRSDVAVVSGIQRGNVKIEGVYTAEGRLK